MALLEAKARAAKADQTAMRLAAAVAALTGEIDNASVAQSAEPGHLTSPETESAKPPRRSKRRRKQAEQENNPLAHLKCAGCGGKGTMSEQVQQAPSGAYVRMLVCGSCRNQSLMG